MPSNDTDPARAALREQIQTMVGVAMVFATDDTPVTQIKKETIALSDSILQLIDRYSSERELDALTQLHRTLDKVTPDVINGHTHWRCGTVYRTIEALKTNKEQRNGKIYRQP